MGSEATQYHKFEHPNLIQESNLKDSKGCAGWFWRFDQKWIRPTLIYKYSKRKLENRIDFGDVLEEYNEIIEELELSINEEEDVEDNTVADPYNNNPGGRNRTDSLFHSLSQNQQRRYTKGGLMSMYYQHQKRKESVYFGGVS